MTEQTEVQELRAEFAALREQVADLAQLVRLLAGGGKSPRAQQIDLPEWLPPEVWEDWNKFRMSKTGWTTKARELSLRTLTALRAAGNDPKAVVEQSIERGWTGLFEVKANNGGSRYESAADRVARINRESAVREKPVFRKLGL